jgi:hypothetical protein
MHRTDTDQARRDPRTSGPGAHPAGTTEGGAFNPSVHDIYWREAYSREPYYKADYSYDDYAPAYRTGYEAAGRYLGQNRRFDDLEPELRANYERIKGKSRLAWENAKDAVRAAWHRVERLMPGDFDNDGR